MKFSVLDIDEVKGKMKSAENAETIFTVLQDADLLTFSNLRILKKMLSAAERNDLLKAVHGFESQKFAIKSGKSLNMLFHLLIIIIV